MLLPLIDLIGGQVVNVTLCPVYPYLNVHFTIHLDIFEVFWSWVYGETIRLLFSLQ